MKDFFKNFVNMEFIPRGTLTKGAGWVSILTGAGCLLGHAIPGMPCNPADALKMILAGLAAVGIGRRGSSTP